LLESFHWLLLDPSELEYKELMEAIDQAWLSLSRISFRWAAFFSFQLSRPSFQRVLLRLSPLLVAGCATATVTPSLQPTGALPPPEMVWVYDFTVTPNEVDLDSGLGPQVARLIGQAVPAREKLRVGRAVARMLANNLATELRGRGINARRANDQIEPDETAASIKGQLRRVDEGNSALRTLVGFGFGGTGLQAHTQLFHGGNGNAQLVAEAETATKSSLLPGIKTIVGIGGGAGSLLAGAVVAGITTITSEEFYQTVEADAKRTAAKLADWVADYYRQQGWLQP
jgi:hypothetical protein